MKITLLALSLSVLQVLLLAPGAHAQWQKLNGPMLLPIHNLYAHGADVYAVTDGEWAQSRELAPGMIASNGAVIIYYPSVFHSSDSGSTWQDMTYYLQKYHGNLSAADLKCFTFCAGNLYSFHPETGVYRSLGGYFVWEVLDTFMGNHNGLTAVAGTSRVLFASMSPGGIVRYDSLADRWSHADAGLPTSKIQWLSAMDDTLYATAGTYGIFKSTDLGSSWNACASRPGDSTAQHIYIVGTTLFVRTNDGHIYRSSDAGGSWTPTMFDTTHYALDYICGDESALYSTCRGIGVCRSTDDGVTWSAFRGDLYDGATASVAYSDGHLIVGGQYGIYQSDLTREQYEWKPLDDRYDRGLSNAIAVRGHSIFYGTKHTGILRSRDHGESWLPINRGLPSPTAGSALLVDGDRVLVSGAYSDDDGDSWVTPATPFSAASLTKIGDSIYAGASGNFYLSADHGTTWKHIEPSGVGTSDNMCWAITKHDGYLFAAFGPGIYRSTDMGTSFTRLPQPDGRIRVILGLQQSSNGLLIASDAGCYRTRDDGITWDTTLNGLQLECFAPVGEVLFSGGEGPFISLDGGNSWAPDGDKTPNTMFTSFALADDGYLYASSFGLGALRRKVGEALVRTPITTATEASRNYPNPFATTTTIRFNIRTSSSVRLRIFDMLGHAVDERQLGYLGVGENEATFDGSSLPSGLYGYELQSADGVQTGRFTVIK